MIDARELLGHDNNVSGQLLALAMRARDLNYLMMSALGDDAHHRGDVLERLGGLDYTEGGGVAMDVATTRRTRGPRPDH